ncbi:hypothetical protein EDC96DRAFT_303477 [Choanephora cucurbitarum]|nr:hypothetical protein EDC96DRAFT_303477 [Choanephora cucurbitarum]
MIDSPIATDSVTNRQASQNASIYYTCRSVLNALQFVPGFEEYMDNESTSGTDTLTKLWHICRQGSSLCYLFNALKPEKPINIPSNSKPKAFIYHFIIACRDQLNFPEETLFTVTDLIQNDTNGFVKVVNTVKRVLDLLEQKEIIEVISQESGNTSDSPKGMRDNVVFELLSTERKYVQDLEALQNYMREVSAQDILSQNTMHYLFANLNSLVDFQRRFLIQIEEQAANPPQEQRFGLLFIQKEADFSVYEPFCANFQIAQDLVVQESAKLQKLSNIMSPTYELPAMLIKPIQRVCKYPLLIQQLIKATPEDWPYSQENKVGLDAIQRVTKNVNETKRVQENIAVVQDLKKHIVDDSMSNPVVIVETAGNLLLHDKFTLQKHDSDHNREMMVFLFEKMILVCKEIKDVNKNAISIKKKRKEGSLIVRCKIQLTRIEHVKGSSSQNGHYTLHISWMDGELQTILLRCRNDEQLRQWLDVIINLKESTTKVDLISAPQTPRMEPSNPLLGYDEDEDSEAEGSNNQNNSDDEEPANSSFFRNRAFSYQHNRLPVEVSSRKASLTPTSSSHIRHFANGMMPPLPRSPTSANYHVPEFNPQLPTSPPTSDPSSPTSIAQATKSSRLNHNIAPSGSLWQRRQQQSLLEEEDEEALESRYEEMVDPHYHHIVDQKSQSASRPSIHHVRQRSQSSPNIQRHIGQLNQNLVPEVPNTANPYKRTSSGNGYYDSMEPSTPSPQQQAASKDITKVKIHYFGARYAVVVPTNIEFDDLVSRIESKIKANGHEFDTALSLKYQDEDGDLITIGANEDVQMGFETKSSNGTVNLYVSS